MEMNNAANNEPSTGNVYQLSDESVIVQGIIFLLDFIILNGLMIVAFFFFRDSIPSFIDKATKVTFVTMNFTMLVSQYFFHTIVTRRLLRFHEVVANVASLVLLQAASMGIALRFMAGASGSGNLFRFTVLFTFAEFVAIILSRLLERAVLRHAPRGMAAVHHI